MVSRKKTIVLQNLLDALYPFPVPAVQVVLRLEQLAHFYGIPSPRCIVRCGAAAEVSASWRVADGKMAARWRTGEAMPSYSCRLSMSQAVNMPLGLAVGPLLRNTHTRKKLGMVGCCFFPKQYANCLESSDDWRKGNSA